MFDCAGPGDNTLSSAERTRSWVLGTWTEDVEPGQPIVPHFNLIQRTGTSRANLAVVKTLLDMSVPGKPNMGTKRGSSNFTGISVWAEALQLLPDQAEIQVDVTVTDKVGNRDSRSLTFKTDFIATITNSTAEFGTVLSGARIWASSETSLYNYVCFESASFTVMMKSRNAGRDDLIATLRNYIL